MTIYTDSDNWMIELAKAEVHDTISFDIGSLKKEDIVAAVKKNCGRWSQAQVGFHGPQCVIRKLHGSTYHLSSQGVSEHGTFDRPGDILEKVKQLRKTNERLRIKWLLTKEYLTDEQLMKFNDEFNQRWNKVRKEYD